MAVKFYVNGRGDMMAEVDGERDLIIAGGDFMQTESNLKATEYLRGVAEEMTNLYNAGQVDEAEALMNEAERKVNEARTAEKFLEPVEF